MDIFYTETLIALLTRIVESLEQIAINTQGNNGILSDPDQRAG